MPDAAVSSSLMEDSEVSLLLEQFEIAMDNDFNAPEALVALEQFRAKIVATLDKGGDVTAEIKHRVGVLKELGQILGLFFDSLDEVESQGLSWLGKSLGVTPIEPKEIEALLAERVAARAAKNFQRSDEIRNDLAKRGVEVLDSKAGVTWRFA